MKFLSIVNTASSMSITHVSFTLLITENGGFFLKTLSINSVYAAITRIMAMMINGFCLSESSTSPCSNAVTERVIPQAGQWILNRVYDGHGGKNLAKPDRILPVKYSTGTKTKGSSI